ncbi:hypothetical protein C8Q80DRAFT_1122951 [Daedaleopsis nitida]|nr:hypothetical protein C8Q80DRAFT_1122951 [Daedaleopsis nitida]
MAPSCHSASSLTTAAAQAAKINHDGNSSRAKGATPACKAGGARKSPAKTAPPKPSPEKVTRAVHMRTAGCHPRGKPIKIPESVDSEAEEVDYDDDDVQADEEMDAEDQDNLKGNEPDTRPDDPKGHLLRWEGLMIWRLKSSAAPTPVKVGAAPSSCRKSTTTAYHRTPAAKWVKDSDEQEEYVLTVTQFPSLLLLDRITIILWYLLSLLVLVEKWARSGTVQLLVAFGKCYALERDFKRKAFLVVNWASS